MDTWHSGGGHHIKNNNNNKKSGTDHSCNDFTCF